MQPGTTKRKPDRPEVLARDLGPAYSPQERVHFKHAVLEELRETQRVGRVVTRRGLVLRGRIGWYSLWEAGLRLEQGPEVAVFRHALEKIS